MRFSRPSIALAALLLSTSASAATLTIATDKSAYRVGEQITLTVTGDSEGETATGLFAQLEFDPLGFTGAAAQTFVPPTDLPVSPS